MTSVLGLRSRCTILRKLSLIRLVEIAVSVITNAAPAESVDAPEASSVKDAGFKYHPDYEDQGKVWLRKNDFEGRSQVDKIEATLRQLEPDHVPGR